MWKNYIFLKKYEGKTSYQSVAELLNEFRNLCDIHSLSTSAMYECQYKSVLFGAVTRCTRISKHTFLYNTVCSLSCFTSIDTMNLDTLLISHTAFRLLFSREVCIFSVESDRNKSDYSLKRNVFIELKLESHSSHMSYAGLLITLATQSQSWNAAKSTSCSSVEGDIRTKDQVTY